MQNARLMDGSRKMLSFQEITGMEGDTITMQEIFAFEQTGDGTTGKVTGRFLSRGIRPKFASKLEGMGIHFEAGLFSQYIVEVGDR